jgi:hypothetical protein
MSLCFNMVRIYRFYNTTELCDEDGYHSTHEI